MNMQQMKTASRILPLAAFLLASCEATRDVAVTSFHVIDAPANYIRHQIDEDNGTTTVTTTTTTSNTVDSDGQRHGQPVTIAASSAHSGPAAPTRERRTAAEAAPAKTRATPRTSPERAAAHSEATPKPEAASTTSDLPSGKPVPGKPGYVYSPYDPNGGYVDVTGFSSGSKVKDPYSNKIFLVP